MRSDRGDITCNADCAGPSVCQLPSGLPAHTSTSEWVCRDGRRCCSLQRLSCAHTQYCCKSNSNLSKGHGGTFDLVTDSAAFKWRTICITAWVSQYKHAKSKREITDQEGESSCQVYLRNYVTARAKTARWRYVNRYAGNTTTSQASQRSIMQYMPKAKQSYPSVGRDRKGGQRLSSKHVLDELD